MEFFIKVCKKFVDILKVLISSLFLTSIVIGITVLINKTINLILNYIGLTGDIRTIALIVILTLILLFICSIILVILSED